MAGTAALFHTTDKRQQSKCLAWFRPGQGWSRRTPCNEWRSRRAGLGQIPHRNSIGENKAKICTALLRYPKNPILSTVAAFRSSGVNGRMKSPASEPLASERCNHGNGASLNQFYNVSVL